MDIIKATNLTKKYGSVTAVDDISFTVKAGEIFAFLGPNGAGKTTTIKMLTTLLTPTSGSILIGGMDPSREPNKVRSQLGIIFQDPSLDDELTPLENMELHGVLYKVERGLRLARTRELLQYVELWDRRDDPVKRFSGGMKRRLELARGLLHHPKILFLDEPTQGLDPQTRNLIWSYIGKLTKQEGVTVFLTTHYMEEADRVARQVAIIDHGKLVMQGTPKKIKSLTKKKTLEEAFIQITGHGIRNEEASAVDRLRVAKQIWGRK